MGYIDRTDLLNLADYEMAADVPEAYRFTTIESGRVELRIDADGDSAADAAARYADYLLFCDCVDDVADIPEKPQRALSGEHVLISPHVVGTLAELGVVDRPVTATTAHLWHMLQDGPWEGGVLHQHGIEVETLKRLPWLLERPALVANSPDDRTKLMLVLSATDDREMPLIAPIKLDAYGRIDIDVFIANLVCTLFGHDNFYGYFGTAMPSENVVFIDSEMEEELLRLTGRAPFANYDGLARNRVLASPQTLGDPSYNPYPDHDAEWLLKTVRTARTKGLS